MFRLKAAAIKFLRKERKRKKWRGDGGENGLFAVNDRNLSFRRFNGDRYLVRVKS